MGHIEVFRLCAPYVYEFKKWFIPLMRTLSVLNLKYNSSINVLTHIDEEQIL
jgi:hypothetical protein